MGSTEEDVRGTKLARSEFGRRGVDLTTADVRVMHGICYVRGTVKAIRGRPMGDLKQECEHIAKILRQRAEIRDVVLEVAYRS